MICSFLVQAVKLILVKLGPVTEKEIELPWITVGEAFEQMIRSAAVHIHKEHFDIVFKCLEVHWFTFFFLLFTRGWKKAVHTYQENYFCPIRPELGFTSFGNINYSVMCMEKNPTFLLQVQSESGGCAALWLVRSLGAQSHIWAKRVCRVCLCRDRYCRPLAGVRAFLILLN